MTKRQLRRIILASNASYLLGGAFTDCITETLSPADLERFHQAQEEIARTWLRQAGFDRAMSAAEILAKVQAED